MLGSNRLREDPHQSLSKDPKEHTLVFVQLKDHFFIPAKQTTGME
jgi:hypothetical protein